jgi:hypothetical protein
VAAVTAAALSRSDFLRAPLLATARSDGFKEWHHFVVQAPGLQLLVNFSLAVEVLAGRAARLIPRLIVIAHDGRWSGTVERFDPAALHASADLGTLTVGGNRMAVGPNGYRIVLHLPKRRIGGELHLTAGGRPAVILVNNQPVANGRLSWLFVPRLRADGVLRLGDRELHFDGAVAYHDHNWGRFRWGGDFGWEWGSVLPTDPADPWSVVFMRKTDRRRHRALSQALYLWRHDEPVAMFRDAAVRVRSSGLLGGGPDCTLPAPMRLVLGGTALDVPALLEVTAGDDLLVEFRPGSYARLAQPSETCVDRSAVLAETAGVARIVGTVRGEDVDVVGAAVMELLHG